MTRPDDELDNLLRSHLSSELDPQRGQAARAFERQVTQPMQRQLQSRSWHSRLAHWKHWGSIGVAMAACVALGAFLPSMLGLQTRTAPTNIAETPVANTGPIITPRLADFERTTVFQHVDRGAVTLESGVPGRRVLQQRYDTLRFVDPTSNERLEYVVPSQQDLFYPVNRQ